LLANIAERPTILKPSPPAARNRASVPLGFDHHDAAWPEHNMIDISALARQHDVVDDDVFVGQLRQESCYILLSGDPTAELGQLLVGGLGLTCRDQQRNNR
jgi:hypothetical protein